MPSHLHEALLLLRHALPEAARRALHDYGGFIRIERRHTEHRVTITVHHLENSRSQRVLWLLEELGMPYEVRRYERNKTTLLAPPELRQVHPLGKSPVIELPTS
jgi:Glutathione S-transferase, N-terminal domain